MLYLTLLISLCGWVSGVPVTLIDLPGQDRTVQGSISIPVTETLNGWKVTVTFTEPVSHVDVKVAQVYSQSADGKVFTLVNEPEFGVKNPGENLEINLFANYTASLPAASAELVNLGLDPFVPPTAVPNTDGTKYNLNEVLEKSILFYEAQRSGKLPWNNRIPWRGDSALNDSGSNGEDLTGGWYDAGDHVKFVFPQAGAVTALAWGLLEFKDAYDGSNQLMNMYDCIKWPLTFLMKCHVSPNQLYVQVGNGQMDHNYWGRPEDMTMSRPVLMVDEQHPGSDVAAEVAAAFAAGYLIFKSNDPLFASDLLRHSKELFSFAERFPGKYSESLPEIGGFYGSDGFVDEIAWAGAWLYRATGDPHYLQVAEKSYPVGADWGFSWGGKASGAMVLLYNLTQKDVYLRDIRATMAGWMPGGQVPYTPRGLAFRTKWGSLRHSANMAMVALMASLQGINSTEYRRWAEGQINYILGDTGRSFVVGFGQNPPTHEHHRASSCPMRPAPCSMANLNTAAPNPHTLYGGLVGGPGDQDEYVDNRQDYVRNEVAVDYNAGFQSAIAGLKAMYIRGLMP